MKLYNLLGSATLIILLLSFLVIPQKVFAVDFNFFNFSGEDSYQILSEFESRKILENFPDILYNKWTSLKSNGYSNPKEETALCLLKHISTLDMFNYFFRDLPLDVSFNITKESLDMVRLIGTEDTSGMIGKIEKGTVDVAVNYLKDYFFKNQIKVSFGAMEMKYKTEFGNVDNPLQYIIMYKRIDDNRGMVVARIYSPKNFIPPTSRGSIGLTSGFANSLKYGENLSPFIIEINGIMKDGLFGSYYWEDKNTAIKTIFPETVPDFGLKPRTWQEKYIINPIKDTINSFSGIFSFFNGSTNDLTEYIFKDNTNQEAIDEEIQKINSGNSLEEDYPIKEEKKKVVNSEEIVNNEEKITIKEEKKEVEDKEKKQEPPIICSKLSQYISSYDIIINEIAWMGSENSANDEWIELKNVSTSDINLKGWTLRDKEDQINIVFEDLIVPMNGFLLLERTNDDSLPSKKADLIYKGSLSNSEEELYLFNKECLLRDFVSSNPKWPAGDSSTRKTMERNNDLNNWHTYSEGKNNNIWGTPKENNSNIGLEAAVIVASSAGGSSSPIISGGGTIPEVTYCSQVNLPFPNIGKVIINEIAWMGSENSANDEWIELKNISDEPVDLSNWQLLDSEDIKIVFNASTIINPQEFYLLERTDNDAVPNVQMNKDYTGRLSNDNESLRLFNSDCQLMDEVSAIPSWPAGDNESRKTMERDNDLNGWHTYFSELADNLSGLWGTPKAENSIKVINEDQEEVPEEEEPLNDNSSHLLITEVQTGEIGETEYVEIYNQTDNPIEMCPNEENCFYLSYYSPTSEWYDPYRNWKFPIGSVINPNSYYIIDIFGDSGDPMLENEADWKVKSMEDKYYELGQIGNLAGSLSLFSGNPKYVKVEVKEGEELIEPTSEEKIAQTLTLKIDTVSWRDVDTFPIVKEGESFLIPEEDKISNVVGRKWSNGKYRDTDNNINDLQFEVPSLRNYVPRIPEKIQDLTTLANEEQKNSVILSWTAPFDEDTVFEDLDYKIYYSHNNQIDDDNLADIEEYTDIEVISGENNKRTATIKDLFYDSKYYFKIVARDPEKNISPLSEEASFVIDEANHQKRAPYYDFKRSGHSQFNGPVGTSFTADVLIEGNQDFPFNNDFTSTSVIDENGTIYFGGGNNKSYDFYAYNSSQNKWSIHCSEACGYYPSLSKDGTIYFSSEHFIYAYSPSGKIIWQKNYTRVFTKSIIIDSEENIYFLATKTSGPVLISVDKNGIETELYNNQEILKGADPDSFTELVVDDSNNIYFAINDFLVKYGNGTAIMQQFFPKYEETYSGSIDIKAIINRVNVSFDGTVVLLDLINGRKVSAGEEYPVLYAIDNNLSKVLWFKDDCRGPIGFNEEEFYYSKILAGSYPMVWYLGVADIVTGNTKWEKAINDVNFVVSDPLNRIYFIKTVGGVFGYDSNNMPEKMEDRLFYISPNKYYNEVVSIGKNNVFFSDTQRVYKIDTPQ
ncbi:MAG: lamin tail domain-containing protein [Candidatus Paceibacterota bacterium]|jgi:hypothetical protein